MTQSLPQLFTSRFLAADVLSSGVVVVPVRISMYPPETLLGELPYPIEHTVRELVPLRRQAGEWPKFSPELWRHLNAVGPEKIAGELSSISQQHDGKALALCCSRTCRKASAATA
jgi:hypothetical protein